MLSRTVIKKLTAAVCSLLTALSIPQAKSAFAETEHNCVIGGSLALGGDIGVEFYLALPGTDSFDRLVLDGPAGEITVSAEELRAETEGEGAGLYKLTYPVAPSQINEKVSVCLKKGDANALLYSREGNKSSSCGVSFSVREYVDAVRSDETAASDLSALADALDLYGRYSAAWFNGAPCPGEDAVLADVTAADLEEYRFRTSGELPEGVSLLGSALLLNHAASYRIYFDKDPGFAFIDGKPAQVSRKDGRYYIEVPDINAKDLNKTHRAAVGDCTMDFCALSYVHSVLANEEDDPGGLVDLVKALYAYSFAADVYFGSLDGSAPELSDADFALTFEGTDGLAENYSFTCGSETFTACYTPYSGGNWRVTDSYKITGKADMVIICEALLRENKVRGRITRYRTAKDMADEWEIHNQGYSAAVSLGMTGAAARLKDVDMDKKDQGRTLEDFLAGFLGLR